ncbi:Ig-like domain-containing protein [Spirosoma flavum]|uniref:Ig-like domain-containing protein n=1 Tax=Spirosoma flavum TaxID=2048557 RepID=A0ABW6ACQ6_9BACT
MYSLIFFVSWPLLECQQPQETGIKIRWHGNRATGISIPQQFVRDASDDSLDQLLAVRLANKETAILGHYRVASDEVIFEPLIPFTRGLNYTIWLRSKQVSKVSIPDLAPGDKPSLLAIYPSQDSLPDNLLKIYLHFSRPMREGQSQKYVSLLKNNADTLPSVFLDLQPELWNADRTLLTLWLDPGRIKRDLQPNKLLGSPLQTGLHYQLVVSAAWPDEQGASLGKVTTKTFLASQRDSLLPNPSLWSIHQPQSGSLQHLEVAFGEALDYSLLTETLHIINEAGKPVSGKWQPGNEEKQGWFKPDEIWKAGRYRLQIESRLEDLAGNNLNRPFDRDITRKDLTVKTQPYVTRFFTIR